MSRFSVVAAAGVMAALALAGTPRRAPAQLRDGTTLTCESGGRLVRCQATLSWRGARLVKQLSRAPCLQGESWGFERNAIWVNDGCRGIFEAGDPFANIGERVVCASAGGERAECPADTRFGVRLVQTVSTARCEEGQSWGTLPRAIWVDRGCRGEFEVGGPDSADVISPASRRFECGRATGGRMTCPTGGRALGVGLVRDLSGGRCRRGSNWGSNDSLIWTSRGCRAVFEVTYRKPEVVIPGGATRRISCGASDELETACKVGGPVLVVRLVQDLSGGRCQDTRNWGRNADFVWTTRGCRGEFEVTYREPNAGPGRRTRTLTCGTFTGSRIECATGGGVVAVRLARDLGDGECREGSSWGHTDSVLWAGRGCRGEFEVTYRSAGDSGRERIRVLTCGAATGRLVNCAIGGSVVTAQLMRDLSDGRCRQGATWGNTETHLWTTRGCRGQFRVTYRGPA